MSMTANITTKRDLKDIVEVYSEEYFNKIDQGVSEDGNLTESKTFQQFKTNNY